LKLETILLTDSGYIKLADLAFAKQLASRSSFTYSIVGVPDTIPPEMLHGNHSSTIEQDRRPMI
jgi:serine/threonine protein kinase